MQDYTPTARFDNTNLIYQNHFKFSIEALPDVTFFVQNINHPGVTVPIAPRGNPFTRIPEVGDHLAFGALDLTFLVDGKMLNYYSLFYWLQGYAFPQSFEQLQQFAAQRRRLLSNPRPALREIQKTSATLYVLQPDTNKTIAEVQYTDVFPTSLGQLSFDTTSDATPLKVSASFEYTYFDIVLVR